MAKLVDAKDLKSFGAMHRVGSSPTPGTMLSAFFFMALAVIRIVVYNWRTTHARPTTYSEMVQHVRGRRISQPQDMG